MRRLHEDAAPKADSICPEDDSGLNKPDQPHTCTPVVLPDAGSEITTDPANPAVAQVQREMFGDGEVWASHDARTSAPDGISLPDLDEVVLRPEYTIREIDPNELIVPLDDQRDGVLLSAVVRSLDEVGIIIPPMVMRRPDGRRTVLLGQGRTRVLWARDRQKESIQVVEVEADGVPPWLVLREVAIEDLRRTLKYERKIEWYKYFRPIIDTIHDSQAEKRKLLADAKRSRTMLLRKSGLPTDEHKLAADTAESWQKSKFGDPVSECKNDAAFAKSERFKYPLTVSLFFREAFSETTARRVLDFSDARDSSDPAVKRFDIEKRLSGLGEGEFSADGIDRRLHSTKRVETLKKKIREHKQLNDRDIEAAIKWIFKRIKAQNLWSWDSVNLGFGMLRRLADVRQHYRCTLDLTTDEAEAYVYGEYPGADVPLNLMAYLTRPNDLVVDFFAGSGATGDAARHFLDPRWPGEHGQWVWWNHWFDLHLDGKGTGGAGRSKNLNHTVFPSGYWEVDHARKCLQFDIEPNRLALEEYGQDFILQHDICNGVNQNIVDLVHRTSTKGAALVYLDPPYLSQADYTSSAPSSEDEGCRTLSADLPKLREARWARSDDVLGSARAKAAAKSSERNLCRMSIPEFVRTLARLIIDCDKILAKDGRIALFMGVDGREGMLLDPAIEVFKGIQDQFERIGQVPFELDRTGPLYEKVWVPSHGYGLTAQIARKRTRGQLANVQRYVWILKRRDPGSTDRLA